MQNRQIQCQERQGSTNISPLALPSDKHNLGVQFFRPPTVMPGYHWHGHIEINIPFGGNVEYLFNNKSVVVQEDHIAIFWALVPHRLIDKKQCQSIAVLDIPVHQFLSWGLPKEFLSQITHGMVVQSESVGLSSYFEAIRWEKELRMKDEQRHQLVYDEIQIMVKRVSLDGWEVLLKNIYKENASVGNASKHTASYVSLMLDYIAEHYNKKLTVANVANAIGLNANYASGLFQDVMKMTIKQYITMMRINHAKALLSDTNKTALDISLTVGFSSVSRFYDNFQKYTCLSPSQYKKMVRSNKKWNCAGISPLERGDKGASDGKSFLE